MDGPAKCVAGADAVDIAAGGRASVKQKHIPKPLALATIGHF